MGRISPSISAKLKKNKVLKGNDGNLWISLPNKNNVYRWVRYSTDLDLTKMKYKIFTPLNQIKEVGKTVLKIVDDKYFYIKVKSKYTDHYLNHKIVLKKLIIGHSYTKERYIQFKINKKLYMVTVLLNKKNKNSKKISEIIDKLKISKHFDENQIYGPFDAVKNTHFGDLIPFHQKYIKKMKPKIKYYTLSGQQIASDYSGKKSLGTVKKEDIKYNDEDQYYYFKDKTVTLATTEDGYFVTGGVYPTYLVTKLNKRKKMRLKGNAIYL